MPTNVGSIPFNILREILAFCQAGHQGQIVLHVGAHRRVEKAAFTHFIPAQFDPCDSVSLDLPTPRPYPEGASCHVFSE